MDENKAPSGIPQAVSNPTDPAAAPPSGHPPAGEPIESKSELASIDSPTLAPSMAEMSGAKSGRDAPKIERPSVVEKSEDVKPESPDDTAPGSREIIPLVALTHARASWKFSRITMLAATVLLA